MQTQKALGLAALQSNFSHFPVPHFSLVKALFVVNPDYKWTAVSISYGTEQGLKSVDFNIYTPKFVRPCPVRPRHGFVDSRLISSNEEFVALAKETLAQDPEGELIIMEPIKALGSAIWCPGSLTIGPGNDGATAGKNAIVLPVLGEISNPDLNIAARIKNTPYLEIVYQEGKDYHNGHKRGIMSQPVAVQLRDGVYVPPATDYVPHEITVSNVVAVDPAVDGLVEWESRVLTFDPSTVVYHPGGALSSHYSVHAVTRGLPVFTSRKPEIGAVLKPAEGQKAKKPSPIKLRAGFIAACRMKAATVSYQAAAQFMIAGCHNSVLWMGNQDYVLGAAMGFAYRLSVAACIGEFRHEPIMCLCEAKTLDKISHSDEACSSNREVVYRKNWTQPLGKVTSRRFYIATRSFYVDNWGGTSIGGKKWGNIGATAMKMYNHVANGEVQDAVATLNALVNLVHNGGWAFNKFIDKDEMDIGAACAAIPAIKVGELIYRTVMMNVQRTAKMPVFLGLTMDAEGASGKYLPQYSANLTPVDLAKIEQDGKEAAEEKKIEEAKQAAENLKMQEEAKTFEEATQLKAAKMFVSQKAQAEFAPPPQVVLHHIMFYDKITYAQVCLRDYGFHVQYVVEGQPKYSTLEIHKKQSDPAVVGFKGAIAHAKQCGVSLANSLAMTNTKYAVLSKTEKGWALHTGDPQSTVFIEKPVEQVAIPMKNIEIGKNWAYQPMPPPKQGALKLVVASVSKSDSYKSIKSAQVDNHGYKFYVQYKPASGLSKSVGVGFHEIPVGSYVGKLKAACVSNPQLPSYNLISTSTYIDLIKTHLGWAEPTTGVVLLPFKTPLEEVK